MKKLIIFLFAILSLQTLAQDRPFKTSGPLWIMQGNNDNLIINKVTGDTAKFKLSNETLEFIVNNIKLKKITFPDNTFINSAVAGGIDTTKIATRYWVLQQIAGLAPIDTVNLRNDINELQNQIKLKADSLDNATRTWVINQGYGTGSGTPVDTTNLRNDITELQNAIKLKADSLDNATRTWVELQNFLKNYIETDPAFSSWNKSDGISITESQISDLKTYLTAELDGDPTNEIQDTTEIPGLKQFVESYSINSYSETDPVWNSQKSGYATTGQNNAKPDSAVTVLTNTYNELTKSIKINGSVNLPNIANNTAATNFVNLNGTTLTKDVIVDLNASTVNKISSDTLAVNNSITFGGLTSFIGVQLLVDDGSIVLPSAMTGFGTIQIGDNQEYAKFSFTTAGVVTLLEWSANVVSTDTDVKLCIFDSGSTITIRNRLGSSLKLRYTIFYSAN